MTLLLATADGTLDKVSVRWRDDVALTVVMASQGYPGDYMKGTEIKGLAQNFGEDVEIFHAGTSLKDGKLLATGGRVLNVTALGKTAGDAQIKAYDSNWKNRLARRLLQKRHWLARDQS